MLPRFALAALPCVCLSMCAALDAREVLLFKNDTPRPMELWICLSHPREWKRPPVYLGPGESRNVEFATNTAYYLLFRDDLRRETPIGWYNISRVRREHPDLRHVSISAITKTCFVLRVVWCWELQRYVEIQVPAVVEFEYRITWYRVVRAPERPVGVFPSAPCPVGFPACGPMLPGCDCCPQCQLR